MKKRIVIGIWGLLSPAFALGMETAIKHVCSENIEKSEYAQIIKIFADSKFEQNAIDKPYACTLIKNGEHANMPALHFLIGSNSSLNRDLRKQLVICLLNKGANPMSTNGKGNTMLHLAAREGWCEIADLLDGNQNLPNMINTKNKSGQTPLHLASTQDMSEWLINHSADVNHYDNESKTPLHEAAYHNRPLIVETLLQRGALREAPDNKGDSPLAIAVQEESISTISVLLNHRANPNVVNNSGQTPLHFASTPDVVERLINYGADVNHYDNESKTPLHEAAYHNRPLIVETLLQRGALREAPDKEGNTPLAIAVQKESIDAIPVLLNHRANPNAVNHKGKSPFAEALEQQTIQTVKLFRQEDVIVPEKFSRFRQSLCTYDGICNRSAHIKSFCKKAYLAIQGIGALTTGILTAAHLHGNRNSNVKILGYSLLATLAGGLSAHLGTRLVDWTIGKIRTKQEKKALILILKNQSDMEQAFGLQKTSNVLHNLDELPQTRVIYRSQRTKDELLRYDIRA